MTDRDIEPDVMLDFTVHWCPRHLSPFSDEWPSGAGVAMVKLFEAAVRDQRIIDVAPKDEEGNASTKAFDPILREHSPLCCFLGDEVMAGIYAEVGKQPPK